MALSGSFTGTTSSDKIIPVIRWSATQNYETNESTVTATLYYYRTNSYTTSGNWTGTLTIGGVTLTRSGVWAYIQQSEYQIVTATYTFPHNIDGTKTLTISATGRVPGTTLESTSISATITLDPIPRTSSVVAENGTLGTGHALTVNKVVEEFTHSIAYACGSSVGWVCDETSNKSISWTPPISLAKENTTGESVTVTFIIYTYYNGSSIGQQTKSVSFAIPASVKPSCSFSVSDLYGYSSTYGAYVQNKSAFKVVTTPTISHGAEIIMTTVTVDGVTYYGNTVESNVVRNYGNLTITVTVKDTRNRIGTASRTVSVLEYIPPQITGLTVHRCNADGVANAQGAYCMVTINSRITALNNKNATRYTLEYKKTSASGYTTVDMSSYNGVFVLSADTAMFAADSGVSYDVRYTVADAFGSVTKTALLSTGFAIMHWLASGLGMAIGKVAELANVFDIGWKTKFSGGILHPVIEKSTNLNDVITPNTYAGKDASSAGYLNCPISSGTFTLEVISTGTDGEVVQRLTSAVKGDHKVYIRSYRQATWGSWFTERTSISTLQSNYTTLKNKVDLLSNSSSYAHGRVYVEVAAMPNNTLSMTNVTLPDDVTEYWIENAWMKSSDGKRHMLPYFTTSASMWVQCWIDSSKRLTINSNFAANSYSGHFVIAYRLPTD